MPLNGGVAAPGAHVTAVSRSQDKLDIFVGTDSCVYPATWEPGFTESVALQILAPGDACYASWISDGISGFISDAPPSA